MKKMLVIGLLAVAGCSSPVAAAPSPSTQPVVSVADQGGVTEGMYLVGGDIEAGRYKTTGPDRGVVRGFKDCMISHFKDDTGDRGTMIGYPKLIKGPFSVTLQDGRFVKFQGSCEWYKI